MAEQFFNGLRKNLQKGRIKPALERLQNYVEGHGLIDDYGNDLILQFAQINSLNADKHAGTISDENYRMGVAKKINAILYYIDEIEEEVVEVVDASESVVNVNIPKVIQHEKNISNVLKSISWLGQGIKSSKSVCKIEVRGKQTAKGPKKMVGTGFLLKGNWIMTNHHVIGTTEEAETCVLYFDFEKDLEDNIKNTFNYKLDPSQGFYTDVALDFTLIKIKDETDRPLSNWGFLNVIPEEYADESNIGDHVTIIQHPRGGPKQIALNENQITKVENDAILYLTDTEQGSSGSPVFNDKWTVIALHHASVPVEDDKGVNGYHNRGIPMPLILKHLESLGVRFD